MELRNPFSPDVSAEAFRVWTNQFDFSDQYIISRLLTHFRYYDARRVRELLQLVHAKISLHIEKDANLFLVSLGADSSPRTALAHMYSEVNDFPMERVVSFSDAQELRLHSGNLLVFLDYLVTSGHHGCSVWKKLNSIGTGAKPFFASLVATTAGLERMRRETSFRIVAGEEVASPPPLSDETEVFRPDELSAARSALHRHCARLDRQRSDLAHTTSRGLVGFFFGIPRNTFPIFWSRANGWKPLLPVTGESPDRVSLAEAHSGMLRPTGPKVSWRYETDDKVLSEFKDWDITNLVRESLISLAIQEKHLPSYLSLIQNWKFHREERKEQCCAFAIVSDTHTIPEDSIYLRNVKPRLADADDVTSLALKVKGYDGAVVIKANGEVVGLCDYPRVTVASAGLLPVKLDQAAAFSRRTRGFVYVAEGDGQASIFMGGQRILIHRNSTWSLGGQVELDAAIQRIGAHTTCLKDAVTIAALLSQAGEGGMLVIGDHERVLSYAADDGADIQVELVNVLLDRPNRVKGLASRDGAVVVDQGGRIIRASCTLRPPLGTICEIDPTRGTRHSTASAITGCTSAVAVAVSVDGTITIYHGGRKCFSGFV